MYSDETGEGRIGAVHLWTSVLEFVKNGALLRFVVLFNFGVMTLSASIASAVEVPDVLDSQSAAPDEALSGYRFTFEKGEALLVARQLPISDRNEGFTPTSVDPIMMFRLSDESASAEIGVEVLGTEPIMSFTRFIVALGGRYRDGGFDSRFEYSYPRDTLPLVPVLQRVPLSPASLRVYLIPFGQTADGQVLSLMVLIGSIEDMRDMVDVVTKNPKFNWDDWGLVID